MFPTRESRQVNSFKNYLRIQWRIRYDIISNWFFLRKDEHNETRYMRSMQEQSGGQKFDPRLQDDVSILYECKQIISRGVTVWLRFSYKMEIWLLQDQNSMSRTKIWCITVHDPLTVTILPSSFQENESRNIPDSLRLGSAHKSVWFAYRAKTDLIWC